MADEENKSGEGKNAGGGPIHVDSAGGGYYADMEKVQEMIAWARARVLVAGYDKSMWTEDHDKTMSDFLLDPAKSLLILYVKKDEDVLVCKGGNMLPDSNQFYEAQFFVRNPSESLTPNTINRVVQYGVFSPDSIDSLLRVMDGIYVPFVVGNTTLPGSVRRSLTSQMHRFMAHLTETSYQTKGRTVLYLPQESIDLTDTDTVLEDKDLVQRLESTVIRWTRQIKEVINLQDNSQDAETAGPLDEINFWSERTVDLSGIREQLHDRTVLRIAELLKHVKSTYLKSFEDLSATIHEGSNEAEDNLKFLNCLRPVCEEIEKSSPPEVVALLPKLLKVIRMIWNVSGHYNRQERLTGLLRKVSNQIMARCCDYIPLSGVFDQDGDVQTSIDRLRECIACGEAWRVEYEKTKAAISRSPKTKDWSFPSESGIFAQIDAFVQRCKDLDEVCQGKIQFAPKPRSDLPVFGGVHGNEIVRGILGVSKQFESHMEKMRSVKYNVLDVKVTQWHSDFNVFKQSIKDLEVMMGNVMNSAFESVGSLKDAVDLLEAFECLSTKENVKRSLEKKTEHVIGLFLSQLQTLRQQFDKNNTKPPVQTSEPKFSGAAVWARGIRDLVEELWANLKKSKHWLPRVRQWSEARTNYEQFIGVLGQYIERKYNDWYESLESLDHGLLNEKLEAKLIVKNKVVTEKTDPVRGIVHDVKNHLSSNFDHDLIQLFNEVRLWGEFDGINIPYVAHDIAGQQKERLRVVRAGVSMVVRLYNTIIDDLAENERRLFSESDLMNDSTALPKFFERRLFSDHIRKLDRRIAPGIFKLNWTSKNVKEWFIQNWTDACRETTKIVASYKDGMAQIKQQCRLITNTQLVLIEKNVIYEDGEFESKQKTHRESVKAALKAAYATISETMKQLYSNFEGQPPEVQKEWRHLKYLAIKITTEPPSGLRPNLTRMINLVSEEQFERCEKKNIFKPLLFSLCWFHAILIERRKFRNLGFNIPYEFNESDFVISQDVLGLYVDAYERTPWDALKYLISQANYGGRVTDELDARLIQVYISQFFNPDVLAIQNYPLSELKTYVTPPPAALEAYKNIINDLPQEDDPRAFGQHPNAAIASQISNSLDLLRTLLSLAPQTAGEGGETPGEIVLKVARSMKEQMPAVFRMKDIIEELSSRSDPDPLKTVLLQELDRYNKLLKVLQTSLAQLELGIQGLSVITPELEEVFNGMLSGQVPDMWAFAYPSLKPLGAWTRDLFLRIEQMDKWAKVALPKVFWFTGFTYPTGFLTALLQTCARKTGEAIDALGWEFNVIPQEENGISQYPKDGAYMKGIYLEGARWDYEHGYLAEPLPMELFSPMPIIHFKPAMAKKKAPRGTYSCPMYMYPLRTGTRERPSFVLMVHLKSGQQSSDFWIKRGTALLLSLAE